MKRLFRTAMTASVLLCAIAGQVSAQATRTWVSGVGDDVNPCSRTAPCKTFAGAISKTAAGGEIDALDPGGFGSLTITKAITIDGGGGVVASVLASGTNGIVISAGVSDAVVLRNLSINGAGTTAGTDTRGIKFLSGASLVVEHCDVSNMAKRGISIESSTNGAVATIIDTSVHGNTNNGIVVNPPTGITNHVVLNNVRSVNNTAFGLGINVGSIVQVHDSVFSNNTGGGILADNSTLDVNGTFVNGNGTGITSQNGATVRIAGTTVTGNTAGIAISGVSVVNSYGDNYINGNTSGNSGVILISKQ
jgi:hypothetical protein